MAVAGTGGNADCAGSAARPAASEISVGWSRRSGPAPWRTTLRAWACGRPNGWGGWSHNAVMNWVLEAVAGKALAHVKPDEVEWVEADELWTYVGQKKRPAGCGGLLIVLPRK